MRTLFFRDRFQTFLTALICFIAVSALAMGDDRFAITVGAQDKLVIFGPKGERSAEFSVPAIAQPVTVGDVSFQVSFGRDATGQLTAILTPSSTAPAALHFTVLGKSVDADKAVVTLTFASNLKSVTIDPGYVGSVEVNSHRLTRRHVADDTVAPRLTAPPVPVPSAPSAAAAEPTDSAAPVSPAPTPVVSADTAPAPAPQVESSVATRTPAPLASQLAPSMLDQANYPQDKFAQENAAATPVAHSVGVETLSTPATDVSAITSNLSATTFPATTMDAALSATSAAGANVKLFWAEPVTPPDGPPPAVGLNEIKLVEVHGQVSVKLANGETKTGVEGMIVPSGSTVSTLDNASAALFMGGINSARLMPQCELMVTQSLDGAVRKTTLDLQRGAVFSRVGQRSGETQDYQVRTPEGATDATTADMLAFRGNLDDLQGTTTTMNSGLTLDRKRLLAWNPAPLGHGWISDVTDSALAAELPAPVSTYFYFAKDTVAAIEHVVYSPNAALIKINTCPSGDPNAVLKAVLSIVQPFNCKVNDLLARGRNRTSAPSDAAYVHHLVVVSFSQRARGSIDYFDTFSDSRRGSGIGHDRKSGCQDLRPFGTPCLTPY